MTFPTLERPRSRGHSETPASPTHHLTLTHLHVHTQTWASPIIILQLYAPIYTTTTIDIIKRVYTLHTSSTPEHIIPDSVELYMAMFTLGHLMNVHTYIHVHVHSNTVIPTDSAWSKGCYWILCGRGQEGRRDGERRDDKEGKERERNTRVDRWVD